MDATFYSLSVFNNFVLVDATDRSKISSDLKRLYFTVSLYPLSFLTKTPFNDDLKLYRYDYLKVEFDYQPLT